MDITAEQKQNLLSKSLFLLDMDGTLYLGDDLFAPTLEFLETIRKRGGQYRFVTNNSSKSVNEYLKKLDAMGIPAKLEEFCTSSQATARILVKKYGQQPLYVMGTRALKEEFTANGLTVSEQPGEHIACIVLGYDTELVYQKLVDVSRMLTLMPDVGYMATNPDMTCPTEFGFVPDCGAMTDMLEHATGRRPKVIGKPQPDMILYAMEQTGKQKQDTIVIGDRMHTDVLSGIKAGVDTALVLTGESTVADAKAAPQPPTFIFEDIGQMLQILKQG